MRDRFPFYKLIRRAAKYPAYIRLPLTVAMSVLLLPATILIGLVLLVTGVLCGLATLLMLPLYCVVPRDKHAALHRMNPLYIYNELVTGSTVQYRNTGYNDNQF